VDLADVQFRPVSSTGAEGVRPWCLQFTERRSTMRTSQLVRTTIATSAIAAALTLFTVVGAPTANAERPDRGGTGADDGAGLDIGQIVAMRHEAAAQYYVDHARELYGDGFGSAHPH
jgi:hypothetical protein